MSVVPGTAATEVNLNSITPATPEGDNATVIFQAGDPYPDPNDTSKQVRDVSAYIAAAAGGGGVNAQTGTTYTIVASDSGKLVTLDNSSPVAVTITAAATLGGKFFCGVENLGPGIVTMTPASGTIDGAASLALGTGQGVLLYSDGSNFFTERGIGSSGTVTSVALTMPSEFSVSGSPITTSGTLAVTKANAPANQVYAGPASGGAGAPGFRAAVNADMPGDVVVSARKINTTLPLTGGGDLSADRTLASNTFTGDSGSGGLQGDVPAPSPGDTAAGKYLAASGVFSVPPGVRAPYNARKGDGATGRIVSPAIAKTAVNLSLSFWFKPAAQPDYSGNSIIIDLEDPTTSSGDILQFSWNATSSVTGKASVSYTYWSTMSSTNQQQSYQLPSSYWPAMVGVWNHIAITLTSAGVLNVYLNGANVLTESAPLGFAWLYNGGYSVNAYLNALAGYWWDINSDALNSYSSDAVAEVALWNGAILSSTDVTNLAAGYPATLMSIGNPTIYWKFMGTSPEPDLSGNSFTGTVTDTTVVAGPSACASSGLQGPTGAQGDRAGMRCYFDSTTSAGVTNNGSLRFNNVTIGSVTAIYLNVNDVNGVSWASFISHWADATSAIKGYLVIQENVNANTPYSVFSVSVVTNNTTYYTITVAYVAGTAPANLNQLAVNWLRTGDLGATGATGAAGPTGGPSPFAQITVPLALASLTWLNQGGVTVVQNADSTITLTCPVGQSSAIRGLYESPGGTFSRVMGCTAFFGSGQYPSVGAFLRSSYDDKCMIIQLQIRAAAGGNPSLTVEYWSNSTTYGGFATTYYQSVLCGAIWLKVSYDGTNVTFYYSSDGRNWCQFFQEEKATHFTSGHPPNCAGFFLNINGGNLIEQLTAFSWG